MKGNRVSPFIVWIAVLGTAGCAAQKSTQADLEGDPQKMQQQAKEPCGPGSGNAPGQAVDAVNSSDLTAAARDVQPALEAAGKASMGVHKWAADEAGAAGAVFDSKRYRLGAGTCAQELEHMVGGAFASGAGDPNFKVEVRRLTELDAAKVAAAFDAWVRGGAEEERAIAELAGRIGAAGGRYPKLQLFLVKGGGATARNAGVAMVDPDTREAVWFFGRAVRMTADRR